MARIAIKTPFDLAISWMLAVNISLALTGYPLAGVLTTVLGWDSYLVTYPYRAISSGAVVLMALLVLARGRFTFDPLLILFFMLYGFRLFYDANYGLIPDAAFTGVYYVVTVVIPFVGISVGRMYYDERRTILTMLAICTPTVLFLAAQGFAGGGASTLEETGRLGFDALNAVSTGYVALYAILSASLAWNGSRPMQRWVWYAPMIALGSVVIVLASARGAIVGGVLCVIAMSVRRGRVLLLWAVSLVVAYVVAEDAIMRLPLVERFLSTGTDMSSIERFDRLRSSYEFFVQNPLFGYAYLETNYNSFPHNLLLESGLALGIGGLLVMALLQIRLASLSWAGIIGNNRFAALLGIIGLSAAWMSTTLWGSITFWVPLVLLIALASEDRAMQRRLFFRRKTPRAMQPAPIANAVWHGRRLVVPDRGATES